MKTFPDNQGEHDREESERIFRIFYYSLIAGLVLLFMEICILYFLPQYITIASPAIIISYSIFGIVVIWVLLRQRTVAP